MATVYAGTGPTGQVVNLSDPKHPSSHPGPKVQYIWDLAADKQGNLYAATGPERTTLEAGDGRQVVPGLRRKATHLLCLAIGPDGSVYAGGDGEGLIYRIFPDGKATILFDAPQAEVRDPAVGPRRCPVRGDRGGSQRRQRVAELVVRHAGGRDTTVSRGARALIRAWDSSRRGNGEPAHDRIGVQSGGAAQRGLRCRGRLAAAARLRPGRFRRAITPSIGSTPKAFRMKS